MKIEACISCGSRNIRSGTIHDGVLPGYTDALSTYVCDDCNHQGLPIVFDTEEEYNNFLKALRENREQ